MRDKVIMRYVSDDSDLHAMMAHYHADIVRSVLADELREEKVKDMTELEVNGKKIFITIHTTSV